MKFLKAPLPEIHQFDVRQKTIMIPLERELLAECRSIAETTLYNFDKPKSASDVWTSEDREKLAQEYLKHARSGLELIGSDHDPRIVLRAVRYLAGTAIPPMRERTEWFNEGLATLLELACPYAGTPIGGEPFFDDIRRGMEQAEAWGKENENGV